MDFTRVDIIGLSTSPSSGGAYALVLGEVEGNRRLPIIIGAFEAQAIALELEKIQPPRPMTHDLLHRRMDEAAVRIAPLGHLLERRAVGAEEQMHVVANLARKALQAFVDALGKGLHALGVDALTVGAPGTVTFLFEFVDRPDEVSLSVGPAVLGVGAFVGLLYAFVRSYRRSKRDAAEPSGTDERTGPQ